RRLVNLVSRRGPEALKELPPEELAWLPPLDYFIPIEGRYVEKLEETFTGFSIDRRDSSLPGPRTKRDWIARECPNHADYNELLTQDVSEKESHGAGIPHGMMMHGQKSQGFPSQSLWDATMAWSIAGYLDRSPSSSVVQINGAFHSDEHLGTVEQLLKYRPNTHIAVISMCPDEQFPAFDQERLSMLGDIIIITDPSWQPEDGK
ncbi:MAG: ChaN family lipoprotein, partial [Planctomycetes bacterium]|nr:ChaN family lipoprotein [Planctomycetota bacterium]